MEQYCVTKIQKPNRNLVSLKVKRRNGKHYNSFLSNYFPSRQCSIQGSIEASLTLPDSSQSHNRVAALIEPPEFHFLSSAPFCFWAPSLLLFSCAAHRNFTFVVVLSKQMPCYNSLLDDVYVNHHTHHFVSYVSKN